LFIIQEWISIRLKNIGISFWDLDGKDGKNANNFKVQRIFGPDIEHGHGLRANQRQPLPPLK
jgi:hypothetical protein